MSHEVERMFSVREVPWHIDQTRDRTSILADYPGRDEAMEAAGHGFRVLERPIFVGTETGPEWDGGRWKALVRDDTGQTLDVADQSYVVLQNDVLYEVTEAVLAQPNVLYATGGTLKEGRIVWTLSLVDEPATVTGDPSPIYPFLLVSSAHDGTGALKAAMTDIRVVCWNTYSAASGKAARNGREFIFRHTARVMDRIEEAKAVLRGVREQHSAFMELAEELAQEPVTDTGIQRFLVEFIPSPPETLISDRVARNVETARAAVLSVLDGPTCDGIRNTRWGLFSAGVEYLDYLRSTRSGESLFRRTLLRPEPLKDPLLKLVRSVS